MDFLNKAFLQLTELFRSMTIGARITAALLLVLVVVSLAYLFHYQASGPSVYLMGGEAFSTEQLRAMEAALAKEGLGGWTFDGSRIRIPRGQQAAYVAALAKNNALPKLPGDDLDSAASSTSVLMDGQQRQQLIRNAKQKELARRVKAMGFQDALVLYDTETKRGFGMDNVTTASVSVTPLGSQPVTDAQVRAIRGLMVGSVAGLKPEKVAVVDLKHNKSFFGEAGSGGDSSDDVDIARKRTFEQDWKKKILDRVAHIAGVLVSVDVELDNIRSHREREVKHDPKGTPVKSLEKSRTRTNVGTVPAGIAGLKAMQPQALPPTQGRGAQEEEDETTREDLNAIGGRSTEKDMAGLTPKRVKVSIGVPTSYLENVWRTREGATAAAEAKKPSQADLDQIRTQEITKIRESIAPLLPVPEGETDVTKLVSVAEFADIPPETFPEPGIPEKAMSWLGENWSTLGLIGLALVSLLMLRSMFRAAPAAVAPIPVPVAGAGARPWAGAAAAARPSVEETAGPPESPAERRLKRLSGSGPTLRDELSQLILDDPDAAANILRTWIGSAS